MTLELFISIIAVIIAFFSILIGYLSLSSDREHARKSVKPIPKIVGDDYEDELHVYIENAGTGPLIIEKIKISNDKGETKNNLIDWMPLLKNNTWSYFTKNIENTAILPSKKITLLKYRINGKITKELEKERDMVRKSLMNLKIIFDFTNIYEQEFPTYGRHLDHFGRNLNLNNAKTKKKST